MLQIGTYEKPTARDEHGIVELEKCPPENHWNNYPRERRRTRALRICVHSVESTITSRSNRSFGATRS